MPMTTVERTATIQNRLGLHARPASEFVRLAGEFDADVWVVRGDLEVNGKSIMGVMMLAAEAGTQISIRAVGVDAETAVSRLVELVESGFGEEPREGLQPTLEPE